LRRHSSSATGASYKEGHNELEEAEHQDPTGDLDNREQATETPPPILHAKTRLKCVGFSALEGP